MASRDICRSLFPPFVSGLLLAAALAGCSQTAAEETTTAAAQTSAAAETTDTTETVPTETGAEDTEPLASTAKSEGTDSAVPDYSLGENWAYLGQGPEIAAADVFFICPTVYGGDEDVFNMSLADEEAKASFLGATNMEKGIYDADARFFAPYYRQAGLNVYELSAEEREPWLQFASGENDTGVIIAFNSEAESISDSMMIPAGTRTLCINPLSWTTDSTPADKSLNLGACFTDYDGNITEEIPELTGAYIDPERGALKVTDVTPEEYPAGLYIFEDGIYHLYDYQFFYRNLQENVAVRTAAYLEAAAPEEAA